MGYAYGIVEDDLSAAPVRALLALHLAGMHVGSPPGSVYALDLDGLRPPLVTVWTAWHDDRLAGMGALKLTDGATAEVKSMRAHPDFLRQGVGAAILEHIIREARRRGVRRLSLETGSGAAFEPALALYHGRGFLPGPAFGDYVQSAFNRFLHLELEG